MVYGLRATLVSTFAAALIMPVVASSQPLALAPSPLVWQAPERTTEPAPPTDHYAHGPLTATRTADSSACAPPIPRRRPNACGSGGARTATSP
jgi:hypothetical protein